MAAKSIPKRGRKLTDEQVRFARQMHERGRSLGAIAEYLNVHPSTVWDVVHFASYREVR